MKSPDRTNSRRRHGLRAAAAALAMLAAGGIAALAMLAAAGCASSGDDDSEMTTPAGTGGVLGSGGEFGTGGMLGSGGAGAAGIGAAGMGGTGDNGFESSVQPFINKACNCHQSTPVLMAPFSLKRGEAFANLVNKPAMQLPSMMLVKPGSLEESYLWHKINGTQLEVGGMGMIMPYTFPLTADEKKIFERWITAGALP